ncbi:Prephenate dehydratase-domain-containing protein [Geopyxis carbonaria]|nr:Prephenate dehydratase-domain-containing protein [Geopyxis carbonaria]
MVEYDAPSVAYLGPPTSYTHQAALECFSAKDHNFSPQTTIADVFTAVETKSCSYGVVPFENSTNGNVVETLDLLGDRKGSHPSILVCGEAYLDVHHCLLSMTQEIRDIKRIYSHPQALGQCQTWLNSMVKGTERIDVSSTSKAALIVKDEPGSAAIASKIAADVHQLRVLARNIEDSPDNTTRFFILSAGEKAPAITEPGEGDKTLLSFTIDHSQPGALCDSLKVFKDFSVNLTSIASRPSRKRAWNYIFFVEFQGHAETENVKAAVAELRKYCEELRVLGSFPDRQELHRNKGRH